MVIFCMYNMEDGFEIINMNEVYNKIGPSYCRLRVQRPISLKMEYERKLDQTYMNTKTHHRDNNLSEY